MAELPNLIGVCGVSAAAAWLAVTVVRRVVAQRLLDVPNERSSHVTPTPRGGGLGVVVVIISGYAVLVGTRWPAIWVGGLALAVVSFLDDIRQVPARYRLAAQVLVGTAAVMAVSAWQVVELPLVGTVHLGILGTLLALVWIVGLSNAYNFMDGVDAMAAVQALIAGISWIALGRIGSEPALAAVGALVSGTAAGFLWHNWPPARIFMGDVGSVFLGYVFALLAVLGATQAPRLALAGVLVVWPFVFDTSYTLMRRFWRRENLLMAHRSHLYQRLNSAGWSHLSVTLCYAALAIAGSVLSVAYAGEWPFASAGVAVGVPALACGLVALVHRAERGAPTGQAATGIARHAADA